MIVLFIVLGALMIFIAQNNVMPVTLNLGNYIFSGLPLYYVIIGSLLAGLGLAYLIYIVDSIFTGLAMRRKDNKIKQGKNDIVDLTKHVHQLEIENERLKNNTTVIEPQDKNAL